MRRRLGRGRLPRRLVRRAIPPLLVRANQLIASGQFAEGAADLEQLARAAAARGGPHAAALFLEAGRARVLAGQIPEGMDLLKRGLMLLASLRPGPRAARARRRIVDELRAQGRQTEAAEIAGFAAGGESTEPSNEPTTATHRRHHLPTHCPDCGAPVRPDESEWLDDLTAECQYCGSPIRAE